MIILGEVCRVRRTVLNDKALQGVLNGIHLTDLDAILAERSEQVDGLIPGSPYWNPASESGGLVPSHSTQAVIDWSVPEEGTLIVMQRSTHPWYHISVCSEDAPIDVGFTSTRLMLDGATISFCTPFLDEVSLSLAFPPPPGTSQIDCWPPPRWPLSKPERIQFEIKCAPVTATLMWQGLKLDIVVDQNEYWSKKSLRTRVAPRGPAPHPVTEKLLQSLRSFELLARDHGIGVCEVHVQPMIPVSEYAAEAQKKILRDFSLHSPEPNRGPEAFAWYSVGKQLEHEREDYARDLFDPECEIDELWNRVNFDAIPEPPPGQSSVNIYFDAELKHIRSMLLLAANAGLIAHWSGNKDHAIKLSLPI